MSIGKLKSGQKCCLFFDKKIKEKHKTDPYRRRNLLSILIVYAKFDYLHITFYSSLYRGCREIE
jgi:hypothetical protein